MKKQSSKIKFVICIDNSEFPVSLEIFKVYRQLPDADAEQDGDIRIIDESGEDYLYSSRFFVTIQVPQTVKDAYVQIA
ncbi:MAG: hypothetical protein GY943_10125 [Chloroflexi bacterium]|nr:hypothetical protein [Chloroflexota bacterium]